MLQITDDLVRTIVQEVLGNVRMGPGDLTPVRTTSGGAWGVFENVDAAVAAANEAQIKFEALGTAARKQAVACIRKIVIERAEELGRDEMEETKIGRLVHKIEKLKAAGELTPGVEWMKTDAYTGTNGIALVEYAPFGVVGIITPVTHSLPTLAGNAINILASGNALICNPHPSGAKIACKGVALFNQAIHAAIGIDNLLTIIKTPTLESAEAIFQHRDVKLLCVTGGPAVGRAALRSPKRAIVAGPGNPPVVVDETADLDNAAQSIIKGAAYDNNLLCISEKEVFAVASIFDDLMATLAKYKAVQLNASQVAALTKAAFVDDKGKAVLNKDLIGMDAAVLAKAAGMNVPADTEILYGETDEHNPFVDHEQMMPFVPFVRVPDVDTAIALAKKYEHGYRHTAIIHSRNVETITKMGKEMNVTVYVQNGPCMAGLGLGGEGYPSFSIATPTGEGITTPLTFTRQRRSTTVGSMRVV